MAVETQAGGALVFHTRDGLQCSRVRIMANSAGHSNLVVDAGLPFGQAKTGIAVAAPTQGIRPVNRHRVGSWSGGMLGRYGTVAAFAGYRINFHRTGGRVITGGMANQARARFALVRPHLIKLRIGHAVPVGASRQGI